MLDKNEGQFIVEKLLNMSNMEMGYDGKDKQLCNLLERNIIDPAKVVKSSLRYGAGVASILLTAECAIVQDEQQLRRGVRIHE